MEKHMGDGMRVVNSGSMFERDFGYARAVRLGPVVCVSGCTAAGMTGGDMKDMATQTAEAMRRAGEAMEQLGAGWADVVRTRFFVTDIDAWRAVGTVHKELLGDARPATSIVEVSKLVLPELMVEIEVDAYLP
ncbi:Rid family hydrolase [Streptomyces sp. NPDC006208]|uniref:Rid family hydrolase n=1 Tax=Streptomyces sp. NPDC006208 TaxID=3156734 RepID=UPI0033A186B8